MSSDPKGYVYSSNLYAFAGGDPINRRDPTGEQTAGVGSIYRIEGYIDNRKVVYTGSAADIKKRLGSKHHWATLIQDPRTTIWVKGVDADLDIPRSNRGTFFSARNEALRSAEQNAMDEAEMEVEKANKQAASSGEQSTEILNKHRAAVEPELWKARHKVMAAEGWRLFKKGVGGGLNSTNVVANVVDAYKHARASVESRYGWGSYVLRDMGGTFTIGEKISWVVVHTYYKTYVSGPLKGQRIEISQAEAAKYLKEAEALWGTTDWTGEFVPGLLVPQLPISAGETY